MRQKPIDNFIVDFLCPSRKLIIELDGGHHNWDKFKKKDLLRQKKLEKKGYRVLRFWNNDVESNLDGAVSKIAEYL